MNNKLEIFKNSNFGEIRTIVENDEILFCAKDVASALGYSNTKKAVKDHCKKGRERFVTHPQSPNKTIEMIFIPESDVYRLIIKSKLPQAEEFEKWLFEEVLPTLRKTGTYTTQPTLTTKVGFKEQLECVELVAKILELNGSSKLVMLNKVYEENNVPSGLLPDYAESDERGDLRSATELLNKFNLGMKIREFNKLMLEKGYLEERSRLSKSTKSGVKMYKILTKKGLAFGENMVSPHNQKEVQPLYYVDKFLELYKLIV